MLHPCRLSAITAILNRSHRLFFSYRILLYLLGFTILTLGIGCTQSPSSSDASPESAVDSSITALSEDADATNTYLERLLAESWDAYRQRFIQSDGRVIDWESNSRTVSEGQAYAMLRAVLIDDPETFERTLQWAEDNLKRPPQPNDADGEDYLWAWKWGERLDGTWGIQDNNFASDADIDAIHALIWAARRWDRSDYLELAHKKLADLWAQSVVTLPANDPTSTRHYLLPGPLNAFQPEPGKVYINPSYLAPYAFRMFAEVDPDPDHDWQALVDSSYEILDQTQALSQKGLPGDWVILELATQTIQLSPDGAALQSHYGFDAYRVWWRIAWDAAIFEERRAEQFLSNHLHYLQELWQADEQIPAVMKLSGQALSEYEATAQYAMLYPAFQIFEPEIAGAILQQKLLPSYQQGIWDNPDAYYVQNLAWFGLFPINNIPLILMK
ncbi:MAG: glycosyl hydrolase [Leptolyngbya sp. SIO1D8]|nr:glycosyl hydrolase [Leptolyngbya sp. SIO1D8]